jgi:putative transposase
MSFYNLRRPHQAQNNQTPMTVWRAGMDKIEGKRHEPATCILRA